MTVSVEGPVEFNGPIVSTIMSRRGMIAGSTEDDGYCRVDAEVPLSEMFGYSTTLRSATQGKAEFTMEFCKYGRVPNAVQEELIAKAKEEKEAKRKK